MKCKECDGKGEVYEYGLNYTDGDYDECRVCSGTGVVYSDEDPQKWDSEHPGWRRFDAHRSSKWKTRFVLSACGSHFEDIVKVLKVKTGLDYGYKLFSEDGVFPGENAVYMYPCVYFFPLSERRFEDPVTKSELTELYWY